MSDKRDEPTEVHAYTIGEAATALGVSEERVHQLLAEGKLLEMVTRGGTKRLVDPTSVTLRRKTTRT